MNADEAHSGKEEGRTDEKGSSPSLSESVPFIRGRLSGVGGGTLTTAPPLGGKSRDCLIKIGRWEPHYL